MPAKNVEWRPGRAGNAARIPQAHSKGKLPKISWEQIQDRESVGNHFEVGLGILQGMWEVALRGLG